MRAHAIKEFLNKQYMKNMFAVKTMAKKYDNCKVQIILSCNTYFETRRPCAGLNPLPRTIQANDPGTTACPLCAG